jgi:hypothetical protein
MIVRFCQQHNDIELVAVNGSRFMPTLLPQSGSKTIPTLSLDFLMISGIPANRHFLVK